VIGTLCFEFCEFFKFFKCFLEGQSDDKTEPVSSGSDANRNLCLLVVRDGGPDWRIGLSTAMGSSMMVLPSPLLTDKPIVVGDDSVPVTEPPSPKSASPASQVSLIGGAAVADRQET
jgi:hypothetical protein